MTESLGHFACHPWWLLLPAPVAVEFVKGYLPTWSPEQKQVVFTETSDLKWVI